MLNLIFNMQLVLVHYYYQIVSVRVNYNFWISRRFFPSDRFFLSWNFVILKHHQIWYIEGVQGSAFRGSSFRGWNVPAVWAFTTVSLVWNYIKSEPQNRRISNIECRRVVSLRSVFLKMDRIHLFDVRCWTFDVRCSLVSSSIWPAVFWPAAGLNAEPGTFEPSSYLCTDHYLHVNNHI